MATALVPAPVVFVLIFLFTPAVWHFVKGEDNAAPSYRTAARAPVVFVIFDEFNSDALMDASGKLDAARYPNLARLARNSTWFRNAMADHSFTELAVPTMLSGQSAPQGSTPHLWDHQRNLFTMLGGYKIHAVEQVTDLCPEQTCPERGSFPGRLPGLYHDLVLLGAKAVLPDAISLRLPAIKEFKLTPQDEFSHLMSGIQPTQGRTHRPHRGRAPLDQRALACHHGLAALPAAGRLSRLTPNPGGCRRNSSTQGGQNGSRHGRLPAVPQ